MTYRLGYESLCPYVDFYTEGTRDRKESGVCAVTIYDSGGDSDLRARPPQRYRVPAATRAPALGGAEEQLLCRAEVEALPHGLPHPGDTEVGDSQPHVQVHLRAALRPIPQSPCVKEKGRGGVFVGEGACLCSNVRAVCSVWRVNINPCRATEMYFNRVRGKKLKKIIPPEISLP